MSIETNIIVQIIASGIHSENEIEKSFSIESTDNSDIIYKNSLIELISNAWVDKAVLFEKTGLQNYYFLTHKGKIRFGQKSKITI